jgi:aminotransferase EvaB
MNDLGRGLRAERRELLGILGEVVDSGRLVHGPQHALFEEALAGYVGATHVVGVANGTDALELAIRTTMPEGRDTVLTAANCGGYTSVAARRAGFAVAHADVDDVTLCLDPEALAPVLDDRVGVVVVTHLYGRAADVPRIAEICAPRGIAIVEDCAQALGATTPSGPVGGLGDAAAFSFYPTKNLGALGDGGAVATSDRRTADKVRSLRQYGWEGKYSIAVEGGRNSRLDELQAAVLHHRLPRLPRLNDRRREIVAHYAGVASDRMRFVWSPGADFVGHLAVVVTEERAALQEHLAENGVMTDIHYPVPDHRQPAYAPLYVATSLPVTERVAAQVLSVPVFPELTDDEVERVGRALGSF